MLRARAAWVQFAKQLNVPTRPYCTTANNNNKKTTKPTSNNSSNVSENYDEAYKQLDKLDFSTAAKILFTDPPKKRKFGIDFHLVQLFFACMPSLAVYLVAQYARYEMRRMEAELEEKKKKQEEEKAKEMELNATEEKEAESDSELLEVKVRLDKLEEAIKGIVVETKKSVSSQAKRLEDGSEKKDVVTTEPGNMAERDRPNEQERVEQRPGLNQKQVSGSAAVADTSLQDHKGKTQNGRAS